MKKGFTLVELMVVIIILAVLTLMAIPVYTGIEKNVNNSLYEGKIKEVMSKAENYAEESGKVVFDVKTLIEEGKLTPDNELGSFVDPRSKRDMSCDVINIKYENGIYQSKVTESEVCYEKSDLENLYGIFELIIENKEGKEIGEKTEWLKEKEVYVTYKMKEGYENYEKNIKKIRWIGEEESSEKRKKVETTSVKSVKIELEMEIQIDKVDITARNSKEIKLDIERPEVKEESVKLRNEINTSGNRRVEFEISDGFGSGMKEYKISESISCSGGNFKSASDGIQIEYLEEGTYYICVRDKVGNENSDENKEKTKIKVDNVDKEGPVIESFKIYPKKNYQSLETVLEIMAKDNYGEENLKMCISNEEYLKCNWEKYEKNKEWKLSGALDGRKRTVHISIMDESGNMDETSAEYTVYEECSIKEKEITSDWTSCTVACQNKKQTRTYQMKDKNTNKICPNTTGTEERKTVSISASGNKNSSGWYQTLSMSITNPTGTTSSKYCITTGSSCTPNTKVNNNKVTLGSNASGQKVCVSPTGENVSPCSCCTDSYKVDTIDPTVKITAIGKKQSIEIKAEGTDNDSKIAKYEFSKDQKQWYSNTNPKEGTYTFTGLKCNSQTIYVRVTDTAGRVSKVVSASATPNGCEVTATMNGNNLTLNIDMVFNQAITGVYGKYKMLYLFSDAGCPNPKAWNSEQRVVLYCSCVYYKDYVASCSSGVVDSHVLGGTSYLVTMDGKRREETSRGFHSTGLNVTHRINYDIYRKGENYYLGKGSGTQNFYINKSMYATANYSTSNCVERRPGCRGSDCEKMCDVRLQATIELLDVSIREIPVGSNYNDYKNITGMETLEHSIPRYLNVAVAGLWSQDENDWSRISSIKKFDVYDYLAPYICSGPNC